MQAWQFLNSSKTFLNFHSGSSRTEPRDLSSEFQFHFVPEFFFQEPWVDYPIEFSKIQGEKY